MTLASGGGVSHLDWAGHGAESKDGGTVFDSGLIVKGSLSIHQYYCHLQDRNKITWNEDRESSMFQMYFNYKYEFKKNPAEVLKHWFKNE